jgi:hypothetical protein
VARVQASRRRCSCWQIRHRPAGRRRTSSPTRPIPQAKWPGAGFAIAWPHRRAQRGQPHQRLSQSCGGVYENPPV